MTMKRIASTTAMALCLAILGAPVVAQESVNADSLYLGRVIIGYDADGAPVYAGDNVSLLEGSAVTAQGGTARIDDVLRQTPGVTTRLDPGQPAAAIAIRGFQGQGRVTMTVEGVPQNFRLTGHAAEGYAYVDQTMLSSIRVARGAVTTKGGYGLSGSVDFRLIGIDEVLNGKGAGGMARLSYADNGDALSGLVAGAVQHGDASFLFAVSGRDTGDYKNGNDVTVARTGNSTRSYLLRGAYAVSDTTELTGMFYRYEPEFDAASYSQEVVADTFTIGFTHEAGELVNISGNLYFTNTDVLYTDALAGGGYAGRRMETKTTGFDLTNTSTFSWGAWDVVSINGIEYSRDQLGGVDGGVNPTNGKINRGALYTENVFTQGALELTFGLRASSYEVSADKNGTPISFKDSAIDPKISIAYQVNDWLQPYASAYKSLRAPTLQEAIPGNYSGHGFSMDYLANPDLRPETATGYEVGVNIDKSDLLATGDRLTARVAYFDMDVEDYVFQNMQGSMQAGYTIRYENLSGTSRSSGLEIEANYEADLFSAALSYTKSDSKLVGSNLGKDLQAPETFALTLARHFMDKQLSVGATYSYTSGGASISNSTPTDSYGLVDVFASYELSENVALNAKVSNLTDVSYTPWGSSAVNAIDSGTGRTFYIGAQTRF